jgi:hypothetical protein
MQLSNKLKDIDVELYVLANQLRDLKAEFAALGLVSKA